MPTSSSLRLVIIGGVAAGASAAARARRLSESAAITLIERGPDVSFANCGLPYFIGGEIAERSALAVQTPQTLKAMLNLDVRTGTEAVAIDRASRCVLVRTLATGEEARLYYDKLILAPGATPVRPPLPGVADARIHTLRTLQDMDRIKAAAEGVSRVAVIGAGFIGLEMTEQLVRPGRSVTLIELENQVLPPLDRPMTALLEDELRRRRVELILGDGVQGFANSPSGIRVILASGRAVEAELVVLSIGVRPETSLARDAGLAVGPRGHIKVNGTMQTSDPNIYAAGDAIETPDRITGEACAVPLGGPANRQGRIAADHIFRGDKARPYPGSLGTAIVRVFDVAAGLTGWSEKRLRAAGKAYQAVTVGDNHHAGYFPGARPITLRIVWSPDDGRVLGAQATGFAGVDKRLDVIATAIARRLTIDDLCHLELAYAPPYGSAKDLVNLAGFAATNIRDGLVEIVDAIPEDADIQVVDARPPALAQSHPLPRSGAGSVVNIPLGELRRRHTELDRSRPVVTACALGKTSYFAARILAQHGFRVRSFSGGIRGSIDPRTPVKPPPPK